MLRFTGAAALAAALAFSMPQARAQQQGPGWFMPNQPQHRAAPAARPAAPRAPVVQAPVAPPPQAAAEPPPEPMPDLSKLPIPELPALARSSAPPAAVIGVLGVPEVMRASTAGQQVERTIGERREKLNQDAQKEQTAWRDLQQSLANERSKLSAEQIRTRERELQERITNAQKTFRDRNRLIQEAAQVGLSQIERTLVAVIREVAESRGMNLVLHRQQVALNVNEFDITQQVADQLNKVLPSVAIPPEGVGASAFVAQIEKEHPAKPTAEDAKAMPASAPAGSAPATPAPAEPKPAPAKAAPAKHR